MKLNYEQKVIYGAMGVSVIADVVVYFTTLGGGNQEHGGLGFILLMILANGLLVLGLCLSGIIIRLLKNGNAYKERAKSFFLAAGLVLLIGTSLCFGGLFTLS